MRKNNKPRYESLKFATENPEDADKIISEDRKGRLSYLISGILLILVGIGIYFYRPEKSQLEAGFWVLKLKGEFPAIPIVIILSGLLLTYLGRPEFTYTQGKKQNSPRNKEKKAGSGEAAE